MSTGADVDVGSLYYVLGKQGSSSRVKQLQAMLELRKAGEAAKGGGGAAHAPAERLVL